MSRPSVRSFLSYIRRYWSVRRYFRSPGDGRKYPQIRAITLLKALLISRLVREESFAAVEAMVRSEARQAMSVGCSFGDDTLGYFTERLATTNLREGTTGVIRQAKRNKAFDKSRLIGVVVDGTGSGRSEAKKCDWCRPIRNAKKETIGYHHKLVMISVAGTGLTLPFDVEPYGPGDSEYSAAHRLLRRAIANVGSRFADYVVADGEYATAPFLHTATELGLRVVARLKANLPELLDAAQRRFAHHPPDKTFCHRSDRVEVWDADDFDPWDTLQWETVRVIRYRQHKPDGKIVEAYWLTNFSRNEASSQALYEIAKSRWEIENQGFNDAKNRYGFEHICHHECNSLLINWLITVLVLTLERLYRLRFLHRGNHRALTAIALLRHLRLTLAPAVDTS